DLPQSKLDLLLRQGNALNMALNKVPITVRELLARAAGAEMIAQCGQHQRLKLSRGNTAERCGRPRFLLQHGLGDVVAIACAPRVGVRRPHAAPPAIKAAAGRQRGWPPQPAAPPPRLGGKLALHRLKQRGIENRLMPPVVDLTAIDHLADIETVLKKIRERAN